MTPFQSLPETWRANPWLLEAHIMHARLSRDPNRQDSQTTLFHRFHYAYPMLLLPMPSAFNKNDWSLGRWLTHNRWGIWSVWDSDYPSGFTTTKPAASDRPSRLRQRLLPKFLQQKLAGSKQRIPSLGDVFKGGHEVNTFFPSLESIQSMYREKLGFDPAECDVMLLTVPRLLGMGFNPVSFWFFLDKNLTTSTDSPTIRAVLCHVNNTFGQFHQYICVPPTGTAILPNQVIEMTKQFHVSPFLPNTGKYKFIFNIQYDKLEIAIDYHDQNNPITIKTHLRGTLQPVNTHSMAQLTRRFPWLMFRSLWYIHWQAWHLWRKKVSFYRLPQQGERVSTNQVDQHWS